MIESLMVSLELPMEQDGHHHRDLRQHGGGQHSPDAAKGLEGGQAAARSRVMLCGFGGGLSWGAALVDW